MKIARLLFPAVLLGFAAHFLRIFEIVGLNTLQLWFALILNPPHDIFLYFQILTGAFRNNMPCDLLFQGAQFENSIGLTL